MTDQTPTPTRTPTASRPVPARRARRVGVAALTIGILALGACSAATPEIADVTVETTSAPSLAPGGTAAPVGSEAPVGADDQNPDPDDPSTKGTQNVQLRADGVTIHAAPDAASPEVVRLDRQTELGSRTTLLVLDQDADWYRVGLPIRPNGSSGWVRAADVTVRTNDLAVEVDLDARRLTVFRGGEVAIESTVAIGADETPTPTGSYFITDLVENVDPDAGYGPFALGLSGHSDTLTEFAGGDGQIGVHGTSDPASIGRNVSHGCIRLPNDVITELARSLPLGTPVVIR